MEREECKYKNEKALKRAFEGKKNISALQIV
jgi:hypothetical protein